MFHRRWLTRRFATNVLALASSPPTRAGWPSHPPWRLRAASEPPDPPDRATHGNASRPSPSSAAAAVFPAADSSCDSGAPRKHTSDPLPATNHLRNCSNPASFRNTSASWPNTSNCTCRRFSGLDRKLPASERTSQRSSREAVASAAPSAAVSAESFSLSRRQLPRPALVLFHLRVVERCAA